MHECLFYCYDIRQCVTRFYNTARQSNKFKMASGKGSHWIINKQLLKVGKINDWYGWASLSSSRQNAPI